MRSATLIALAIWHAKASTSTSIPSTSTTLPAPTCLPTRSTVPENLHQKPPDNPDLLNAIATICASEKYPAAAYQGKSWVFSLSGGEKPCAEECEAAFLSILKTCVVRDSRAGGGIKDKGNVYGVEEVKTGKVLRRVGARQDRGEEGFDEEDEGEGEGEEEDDEVDRDDDAIEKRSSSEWWAATHWKSGNGGETTRDIGSGEDAFDDDDDENEDALEKRQSLHKPAPGYGWLGIGGPAGHQKRELDEDFPIEDPVEGAVEGSEGLEERSSSEWYWATHGRNPVNGNGKGWKRDARVYG
ncbi:hypothetical protein P280DRAFT_470012 [Massarina eburnea CBS 473.64]|uniref:Uncharacterized protein n=1 Tax=Massarina eburnea CBS 473.64 TaxID=1395130 RepID=A0A6A6S1L0_9PLEO|nr:hypothetical protein P280DRAFT_470012 [Massarina eburnea CBS 473.64]